MGAGEVRETAAARTYEQSILVIINSLMTSIFYKAFQKETSP